MKKLFFAIGILISFFASAQLPTISGVTNLNSRYQMIDGYFYHQMRVPKDTVHLADSGSISFKGDNFYYSFGGLKQIPGMKFNITSDWLASDVLVLQDSVNVTNVHKATSGSCITLDPGTSVTITDLGGLQYLIGPSHFTDGSGVHHDYPQTIVTIPNGTAGTDSSRLDLLALSAGGPTSIQGSNSDNPSTPDFDPCTYYILGTVLINGTDTQPANTSTNTDVYQETGVNPPEYTESTGGTITSNKTATTNPAKGTHDISTTAMSQNAFIAFAPPSAQAMNQFYTFNLRIRLNSVFNAATNLSVTFRNGAVTSNAIQLTAYGLVKATTGSYQYISIPISAFTGLSQFTSIRITRNGTGGTVSFLLDDIYLQNLGITPPSAQAALTTVVATSGSYTTPGPNGIINIVGTSGISTSITGSTLTISGAGITPTNIYNSDGVLTGNRNLDGNTNVLQFQNLSQFTASDVSGNYAISVNGSVAQIAGQFASVSALQSLVDISAVLDDGHKSDFAVWQDSIVLNVAEGDYRIYNVPDTSDYTGLKVLYWEPISHKLYQGTGGGGGGSDSPDRINGVATNDVSAAMGGFNFVLNGASQITLVSASGSINLLSSGLILEDDRGTPKGFEYDGDYSANYTGQSLIARKDAPSIQTGTSAPGSTPTKVGDIYVDTSAKKLYFATGTSSSADWTIAN